jgi:hypothetical protein
MTSDLPPSVQKLLEDLKPLEAGFEEGWLRDVAGKFKDPIKMHTCMLTTYMLGAAHVLETVNNHAVSKKIRSIMLHVMTEEVNAYEVKITKS